MDGSSQDYDQPERLILYKYLYDLIYRYAPGLVAELKTKSADETIRKLQALIDDPVIYHKSQDEEDEKLQLESPSREES